MRDKTAITRDNAAILRTLRASAADINRPERKGGKLAPAKAAILASCANAPNGCRLPPLREMALALGVSIVTIQRAITELTREGRLASRERSGIFYQRNLPGTPEADATAPGQCAPGQCAPKDSDAPHTAGGTLRTTEFVFATDSVAPFQRQFWDGVADGFRRASVHLKPQILYAAEKPERDGQCDVCERHNHSQPAEATNRLLRLSDLLTGPLAALRHFLLDEHHLALYYRTYYLFLNPQLLHEAGLPLPDYQDFSGQENYLHAAQSKLQRAGLLMPVSVLTPYTLLGANLVQQIRNLLGGVSSDLDFAPVARFCRLLRYDVSHDQPLEEFHSRRSPFFVGYSVNYWQLQACPPAFPWLAYPIYRCDDSLYLLPMAGTIRADSRRPLESLRFLQYLLCEPVQAQFQRHGNLCATLQPLPQEQPLDCARLPLQQAIARSAPSYLSQESDGYLAENIFGGELWQAIIHGLDPAECLRNATAFARHYHSNFHTCRTEL